MKKNAPLSLVCLTLLVVSLTPELSHAQAGRPEMVLREIIHGSHGTYGGGRPPNKIELNAKNGFVEFSREWPKGYTESFRFTYQFDRDMNTLEFSSEYPYEINLIPLSKPYHKFDHYNFRNPFVRGATDTAGSSSGLLNKLVRDKQWKYPDTGGRWIDKRSDFIYAYKAKPTQLVGPVRSKFVTVDYSGQPNGKRFGWLYFMIAAVGQTGFDYNVIFAYEVLDSDDQTGTNTGTGASSGSVGGRDTGASGGRGGVGSTGAGTSGGRTGSTGTSTSGDTAAGSGRTRTLPPDVPFVQLPEPNGGLILEAEKREVTVGESVMVPVWLRNAAGVANINFTVNYDPRVARLESDLVRGNLLSNALFSNNPRQGGVIRVGFAQTSGLSGTGTVAYLPFKAVGKPGSRTPLGLTVTTINNPTGTKLGIRRINGSIAILDPRDQLQGDCDGDKKLTELDAMCALQMSVRLIPTKKVLDFDTDGDVTSRDAVIILLRAIGRR